MLIYTSYATAQKLGFKKGKSIPLRTFYFMIDGRCTYDCSFCTHARNSKSDLKFLSRVIWFGHSMDEILNSMEELVERPKRLCFQIVSSVGYHKRSLKIIEKFLKFEIPISVNFRPKDVDEVDDYIKLGVDKIGIAMDAVTPNIFKKVRDGRWDDLYSILKESARRFPKKIVTHIIVGMDESEREVENFLKEMKMIGVKVGIFGFTPIKGTRMEYHPPVALDYLKRVKILYSNIFGLDTETDPLLIPTGCPDCDKPFYDISPLRLKNSLTKLV